MHELPSELNNSLRSWRGSLHGGTTSPRHVDADGNVDIEKSPGARRRGDDPNGRGHNEYGDGGTEDPGRPGIYSFDEALNSSLILHPTRSRRRMRDLLRDQQSSSSLSNDTAKKSVFGQAPDVADPDPASSRLVNETRPLTKEDFFYLIGMNPPTGDRQHPKELRMRGGLYAKIWYEYEFVQSKYRVYDVLTYAFLIVQLFLSAVFIVLGSLANTHNLAIPLLGAVSTVVAGVLALMKGQGLPNRLRMSRDSFRNCLFEAEELYWDVNANRQVYFSDIKNLREDFLRVLELARRNHPDTWNASATGVAQGIEQLKTKSAGPPKK